MKKLGKYLDERSLPRLGVLLCFSAVFMLFASPYTTPLNAYYGYDSAVFMSFGKGITHGLRLYLDLYDNKGPMIFYFNALGYLLGGRMGLWILQVVFMTFAFELSYRTARLFTGRGTAWLSVIVLLFLYCGTVGEGNMTEEWSLVFSLLPLWLSLRFIKTGAPAYRHPKWYSVIYGVCFGVNFMMRATNAAIVCGVLGYVSIILYDLNNTSHNNDRMQSLHTVGAGLIGLAFFSTVLPGLSEANSLPTAVRVIAGILALGFFALLIYLTLIAGGRTNWKRKDPKKRWWEKDLVTTGAYALCRHPSVWAMLFFCLLLIPAANFDPWCATTFSLCGLLLAMYEDVNVFPVLMRGYNAYKDTTPFLFPTKESIRRCFNGKKAK